MLGSEDEADSVRHKPFMPDTGEYIRVTDVLTSTYTSSCVSDDPLRCFRGGLGDDAVSLALSLLFRSSARGCRAFSLG